MDLVPLRYGLKYGKLRECARLPVYIPPGAARYFAELGCSLDGDPHFFDGTYQVSEYSPDTRLHIGGFDFTFRSVKHYIPSYGMTVEAGRRLAFSADAAPCGSLVDVARDANLFLCEAAIRGLDEDDPEPTLRGHLTAAEAGAIAQKAGAERLLLTHYRASKAHDPELLAGAATTFSGPVELATEHKTYVV
jgi:ribonuclease BN (tRNA processing enzyme)